jgi:hypothetical protein
MWMRFRYAWKERRAELLLNVALPMLLAFVILLYLVFGGLDQFQAAIGKNADSSALVLRSLLASLLPLGSLVFLVWFATKQILSVVQPLSQRVLSYIQLPTYREQMGYQHRVMEDLRFVYSCLKRHEGHESRVVVFIDDLDRCSEEKIIEVLQAITLILGDSKFFVFLGMDTEMIYRAVRAHYSGEQEDDSLPSNLPEQYLHKIIQISFYLPETSRELRRAYLDSLFSAASRQTGEPPLPPPDPKRNGKRTPPSASDGRLPVNFSSIRHSPPVEVEDTPAELATFKEHLRFLEDNPRAVKRLVNLHRLVKIILTVKQQQLLSRKDEQRKLVRWLLFCAGWPELIDDCLDVAEKSPTASDVLAKLIEKLDEEQSDEAQEEQPNQEPEIPEWLRSLKEFAEVDTVEQRLSAQDINNLKLVAQISTLIKASVAAPKNQS